MSKVLCVVALCIAAASCGGQNRPLPQDTPTPRATPTPSPTPVTNPLPDPVPVVRSGVAFVGDSIFGRLAIEPQFINAGYIDSGVFGQRTDEILARLPDILSGKSVCTGYAPPAGSPPDPQFPFTCKTIQPPAEIVILAGWNNMFQGANSAYIAELIPNLQSMVSLARASGVKVVVCTVYAWDPALPAPWMLPTGNAPVTFYDVWRIPLNQDIVNISGITVVDLSAVFAGQTNYTIDGVHPTEAGNVQMMSSIFSSL